MDKIDDIMSGYKAIFEDGYKAGRASVVLPHPCDGELYKDWLLVEYIAKVLEEAKEVVDAYIDLIKDPKNPERIKHLAGECTDVQVAATGVMHKLGYGEEERQRVMKEINESNAKRDGGKRFADEELPAAAPVFKDMEKSEPMKNAECLLPEYLDEYFRDKKIDGETVTLIRGEKYGKFALRVGDELYYVSYEPLKKVYEK